MLTKSQRLIYTFGGWVLIVLTLLTLFNSLSLEYFFVLCFIGFLIIVELSGPFTVKTKWRSRINIIIAIGVLIFALIITKKVMDIIGISILGWK
jgi:general stress protein CsbA